jgi:hypothetical protein
MSSFGENFENLENKILNVPSNIVDSMKRNNIANSIVLLLLLYVILAAPTMSPTVVKLFNNNFFKLVYIFLVMCLVSQNPIFSLVVAVVLLVVLNKLLEPKPQVVIPEANVVNKPIVLQPGAVVTTTASGQTVVLPPSVMAQNNVEHFSSFLGIGDDSTAIQDLRDHLRAVRQQDADLLASQSASGNLSGATSMGQGINVASQSASGNLSDATSMGQGINVASQSASGNLSGATSMGQGINVASQSASGNLSGATSMGQGINGASQSASGNLSGGTVMRQGINGASQSASGNLSGATSMGQGINGASGNLSGGTVMRQGINGASQSASGNLSGATRMGQGINGASGNLSGGTVMRQGINGASQSASGNLSGATRMGQGISGVSQSASVGPSTNIDGERLLRENVKLTSAESSNLYNSLAKFYSDPKIKKSDEMHMAEKLKQKYFPSVNFSNAVLGQKKDEVEMSCKLVCDNKKVEKFENEESNDRLTQRQQMMNLWQANQSKNPAVLPGFVTMEQQNDSCAAAAVNSSCDVLGVNKYHSTSHARVTIDNNPCPEDGEVHGVYENVDKEYADYTN